MKEEFKASAVVKITGVKFKRLQPWMKSGYIEPSIEKANGPGTRNVFSRIDLYKIAFFKKLVESGFFRKYAAEKIGLTRISEFLNYYAKPAQFIIENIWIAFSRVIVKGKYKTQSWIISPELDEIHKGNGFARISKELLKGADDIYVINFTKIKQEINSEIAKIKS